MPRSIWFVESGEGATGGGGGRTRQIVSSIYSREERKGNVVALGKNASPGLIIHCFSLDFGGD